MPIVNFFKDEELVRFYKKKFSYPPPQINIHYKNFFLFDCFPNGHVFVDVGPPVRRLVGLGGVDGAGLLPEQLLRYARVVNLNRQVGFREISVLC